MIKLLTEFRWGHSLKLALLAAGLSGPLSCAKIESARTAVPQKEMPTAEAAKTENLDLIKKPTFDYQEATIDKCKHDKAAPGETCFYFLSRLTPNPKTAPSKKLVVFFSGGEMGCAGSFDAGNTMGYGSLARLYAEQGYVFACAQLFETSVASAAYPYSAEAGRVDALVSTITNRVKALKWWDGEELLIAGVSHGASAPVFAMRHSAIEDGPSWRGAKKTGACFFDGISDIQSHAEWQKTQWSLEQRRGSGADTCLTERDRAYCGRFHLGDNCKRSSTTDILKDSMMTAGKYAAKASDFSIQNWKVVSCGSNRSFPSTCSYYADAIPDDQQSLLCNLLGARCKRQTFPDVAHLGCTDVNTQSACLNWFEAAPKKK